jgi:hypothetical protein
MGPRQPFLRPALSRDRYWIKCMCFHMGDRRLDPLAWPRQPFNPSLIQFETTSPSRLFFMNLYVLSCPLPTHDASMQTLWPSWVMIQNLIPPNSYDPALHPQRESRSTVSCHPILPLLPPL